MEHRFKDFRAEKKTLTRHDAIHEAKASFHTQSFTSHFLSHTGISPVLVLDEQVQGHPKVYAT